MTAEQIGRSIGYGLIMAVILAVTPIALALIVQAWRYFGGVLAGGAP